MCAEVRKVGFYLAGTIGELVGQSERQEKSSGLQTRLLCSARLGQVKHELVTRYHQNTQAFLPARDLNGWRELKA